MKSLKELKIDIHIKMLAYVDEIDTSSGSAYSLKSKDRTNGKTMKK
jgi:hypothetical protein